MNSGTDKITLWTQTDLQLIVGEDRLSKLPNTYRQIRHCKVNIFPFQTTALLYKKPLLKSVHFRTP